MSSFLNKIFYRSMQQTVRPHVPLIRFRKGEPDKRQNASSDNASGKASGLSKVSNVTLPTIEDYQLPKKFWRLPMDDKEIDAINSGGAL